MKYNRELWTKTGKWSSDLAGIPTLLCRFSESHEEGGGDQGEETNSVQEQVSAMIPMAIPWCDIITTDGSYTSDQWYRGPSKLRTLWDQPFCFC